VFAGGSSVLATGALTVAGGSIDFSTGAAINADTLNQSSGILTGSDPLSVAGATVWSGGTMSGSGATVANGGLTLSVSGGGLFLDQRTLSNAASATLAGAVPMDAGNNAVINNLVGATFDVQDAAGIRTNIFVAGPATFNNQGTLTKTGSGTTALQAALN